LFNIFDNRFYHAVGAMPVCLAYPVLHVEAVAKPQTLR
jgi:hypothetical protein